MVFFLRKLAVGLFVSSFSIMMSAQAGIVEPVYKQFKNPNQGSDFRQPSPASISITPDGKKMFVLSHFFKRFYIYDLTTPFDLSTNDNTEISYLKNYDNFNLKVKSNYAMYSKISDYGAGIELSAIF